MLIRRFGAGWVSALGAVLRIGCAGGGSSASAPASDAAMPEPAALTAQTALGEKIFRDGRTASLLDHAGEPFTNPFEMANASAAEVVDKLSRASHAAECQARFGADIFSRPDDAVARVERALAQDQKEDADFRPFSSTCDEFLRGKLELSGQETRGRALFDDPTKGNCIGCHPSGKGADGQFNAAKSHAELGPGLTPVAGRAERVVTVGANLQVAQGAVLKADDQRFRDNTDLNRFNLGVGWSL